MSPEVRDYLDKAREDLADARKILGIGLAKAASRGAYYAAFHAAEAMIVARTGAVAKTHTGVRAALAKLLREAPAVDRGLLAFLAQAYKYKELSDYGVGPNAIVTEEDAADLIAGATLFVERLEVLLAAS